MTTTDGRRYRLARLKVWVAKLPPRDVIAFYVRGPGCVKFVSDRSAS